jgi:tellurite methyltransferase
LLSWLYMNSTLANDVEPDWQAYYEAVAERPPRDTLLRGLANFEQGSVQKSCRTAASPTPLAVDLGCGDGRDTVELLRRGWRVLAIDAEPQAFERLLARPIPMQLLQTQQSRFEELNLPAEVDLINASFCLPFCPPANFPELWQKIVDSLAIGGRFCGQLFGDRDSWAVYPQRSHHTRQQLAELLSPFSVEFFEEEKHPGVTAIGDEKYWHIYHIVAQKKDSCAEKR